MPSVLQTARYNVQTFPRRAAGTIMPMFWYMLIIYVPFSFRFLVDLVTRESGIRAYIIEAVRNIGIIFVHQNGRYFEKIS